MHTYERSLVKEFKGRPFVVLGVNRDQDLEQAHYSAAKLTWRTLWDGPGGPNFRLWNVQGTPMIYLVDRQGMIRWKQTGPPHTQQVLEEQINQLLQETN